MGEDGSGCGCVTEEVRVGDGRLSGRAVGPSGDVRMVGRCWGATPAVRDAVCRVLQGRPVIVDESA